MTIVFDLACNIRSYLSNASLHVVLRFFLSYNFSADNAKLSRKSILRINSTLHVSNLTEARRHGEREMYVRTERKRGTTTDRFNVEKSCKVFERRLQEHSFFSQESEHATLSIRNKPKEIDCKLRTCHGSVGSLSVSGADSSRSTT